MKKKKNKYNTFRFRLWTKTCFLASISFLRMSRDSSKTTHLTPLSGCPRSSAEAMSDEKRSRPGSFPLLVTAYIFPDQVHSPAWGARDNSSLHLLTPTVYCRGWNLQKLSKEQAEQGSAMSIPQSGVDTRGSVQLPTCNRLELFQKFASLLNISMGLTEKQETHSLLESQQESKRDSLKHLMLQ